MTRWFVVIAAIAGLGLRIFLATAYFGTYDQESYEIVVAILRRGGNIYAETRRYNYAPVWGYTLLGLSYVAEWLHLPFHAIVRSFLTIVDGCNALLIGAIAARLGVGRVRSTLAYWLNPAAINQWC